MIEGDKVWTVFDIMPALPPVDPRPAEFVGVHHELTLVRRAGNPQPEVMSEYHTVFDDESEAWAHAAQRLRRYADHVLEEAEKAAAKARAATIARIGT